MALSRKLMAGGLAALALMATAGAALAAPAYVTGNVNVRSGPGTHYSVIDSMRRGQSVDVQQCRGSWCYVEKRGPDGWVSANYLERGGRPSYDDDDYYDRPPVYNPRPRHPRWDDGPSRPPRWNPRNPRHYDRDSSVCFNGPQGYVCIGN